MSWQQDPFWAAAAREIGALAPQVDMVFASAEFLDLHERVVPLEYAWGLGGAGRRVAWCCTKDDAHRLAPWLLEAEHRRHCVWSNEVFVLGAVGWAPSPTGDSLRHWRAWSAKVAQRRAGRGSHGARPRSVPATAQGQGPRVLVVGASAMGNVGDDLLAEVLAQQLHDVHGARVWLSGPDVDAAILSRFDAVVVGGGGLVYASREGANEAQNLGNYLRFGPMCAAAGVPVAMVGVSDQDHAEGIARDPLNAAFARACLPRFQLASTRDEQSTELLRRLGLSDVRTGPDLLFSWAGRAEAVPRAAVGLRRRVALAGELTKVAPLRRLADSAALREALAARELDLLVMSEDDVAPVRNLGVSLRQAGITSRVVDLRGLSFEDLVAAFAAYRLLVTTRFHGLVLAVLARTPVLAHDGPDGKKARLLRHLGHDLAWLSSQRPPEDQTALLLQALTEGLPATPRRAWVPMARTASVHRQALADLLQGRRSAGQGLPGPEPVARMARVSDTSLLSGRPGGADVKLCWAASTHETQGFGNLGDSLSAVVVSALSGRSVEHVGFSQATEKLVAVGSIAHAIEGGTAVIWGSGVSARGGVLVRNVPRTTYDVRAIRGSISAGHLRELGVEVPPVYGDPVWLLPSIFHEAVDKRWELGVIPHIQDIDGFGPQAQPFADSLRTVIGPEWADQVTLINTWHEPTWDGICAVLRRILACKRIVSQSFHGVVIAEAYGIPVLNFRQLAAAENGPRTIRLDRPCTTDPRIWEFYAGGPRQTFEMYVQRRDEPTDWAAVMRAVDERWQPFEYDASALVASFPLPLAYDPLSQRLASTALLRGLRF